MTMHPDLARSALPATPPLTLGPAPERNSQRASAADRHVGTRIRERRVMMGLSQQQLAGMIGVT
jgi:ribosome-binding protein aMBF1 (putative translation factor)